MDATSNSRSSISSSAASTLPPPPPAPTVHHTSGASNSHSRSQPPPPSQSSSSSSAQQQVAAANSLQLLLREDPLLVEFGLTESKFSQDQVAFPYAAALLQEDDDDDKDNNNNNTVTTSTSTTTKQRADLALQDVERKLALVESLAVKLSRTRPEAVAGHLLRLHGYDLGATTTTSTTTTTTTATAADAATDVVVTGNSSRKNNSTTTTTLSAIRDRADRLERQADVLDGVAKRVESSLTRGLTRMETACTRLERVLTLSSTLKSILKMQFESNKLYNYDLDDARDLTRAAASVAILEDLLAQPEFGLQTGIHVVDRMRPQIQNTARQVREAAAVLLQEQLLYNNNNNNNNSRQLPNNNANYYLPQLAATLQVYFHLGELPDAVWKAVDQAHGKAEAVARQLFNAVTLLNLTEQAKKTAKAEARLIQKKLVQVRAEAAHEWAQGMTQVALQIRNMQRVLSRKSDPDTRQVFIDVVAAAPIPAAYAEFAAAMNNRNAQQQQQQGGFSIFALFWSRLCQSLSLILDNILTQDQEKHKDEVAALYPAVRAAALELVGRLQETLLLPEDATGGAAAHMAGIMGGSSLLDDTFLEWTTGQQDQQQQDGSDNIMTNGGGGGGENPQAAADAWTTTHVVSSSSSSEHAESSSVQPSSSQRFLLQAGGGRLSSASSMSAVFQSSEWKTLQGNGKTRSGLYPLEQAFLDACTERLCAPLQYMFPENVTLDEDGVAISSGLSLLPSKYDVQRFDENIRQELSLADPREGGGDLTAVTMIAECVVTMISGFCERAKNAVSGVGENGYLQDDWTMTESLEHDRKVVAIMYALAKYLRNAPEKTFVAPYRPATSSQHEEAANMCQAALVPALQDIDRMVKTVILNPLCRAINRRIANLCAKMHQGIYIESGGGLEDDSPAFVQKYLSNVFESIAQNLLARFPPEYASMLASKIAVFTIYCFVSNASLVRPLGESARLHITQDLADLELSLEQLVLKNGGTVSLGQIENGRPYAELRAVRQMLFWSGLEDENKSSLDVTKSLLREAWMKDVRPSTVFHYLFSFAPSLLSSPHHMKRMKAEEYVSMLVQLDGSMDDGEDVAWMTVMLCCDSYQQRASSVAGSTDGDPRVPQVLMTLGQELLRRRRH